MTFHAIFFGWEERRRSRTRWWWAACLVLAWGTLAAHAQDRVYPDDAGIINVKAAPYNAQGDGVTDDTAAIQRALDATPGGNRIIYFPAGVYLISNTLRWAEAKHPDGSFNEGGSWKNQIFEGQSRERSIIRLAPNARGYDDPNRPKAMIWTGPKPAQRFRNAVRNLTLDAGNHVGAIGLQFNTSNQGTVREVTLRGRGVVGLDMAFTSEIGPLLIKDVRIEGFAVGIHTGGSEVNSMTLEDVTLRGQSVAGLRNDGQCVSIHRLHVSGPAVALENRHHHGLITLIEARLEGTESARDLPAIVNRAVFFGRDIQTSGYQRALTSTGPNGGGVAGATIREFVSHPPLTTTPALGRSLRLPVVDTPDVPWDALDQWASPTHFGAVSNDGKDDSDAIQKAIDSGKTTLYFPAGLYHINKTVVLRGKVRRVIGCEALIEVMNDLRGRDEPVFRVEDGAAPVVVVERLQGNPWGGGRFRWFEHASRRDLVIRHCTFYVGHSYRNSVRGGRVFIEDVSNQTPESGFWMFDGQTVYARQWNVENIGTKITNDGGTMWVLGYKTERSGTLIDTRRGATELLGGLCYSLHYDKPEPMFRHTDADVSLTIGEAVYDWGKPFGVLVAEQVGDRTQELNMAQAPRRALGSVIALYRSSNRTPAPAAAAPPPTPTDLQAKALSPSQVALTWTPPADPDVEYVVRRDQKVVGVTVEPAFVDHSLQEVSTHRYEVVARDALGRASAPAAVAATTLPDRTPPALESARALRHPDRIELYFTKPLDEISVKPDRFKVEGLKVTAARLTGNPAAVELRVEGNWPSGEILGSIASGLTDRSRARNAMSAAAFRVAPPPPDQLILERNFDRDEIGAVPAGVFCNSDWNGGKVEPRVVEGTAPGDRALRLTVTRFGQVVLARVPMQADMTYVVTADIAGGQAGQAVVLQVRQWDAPYTIYGQGEVKLSGTGRQPLSFTFRASQNAADVPLFFIVQGDGTFVLDNIRYAKAGD